MPGLLRGSPRRPVPSSEGFARVEKLAGKAAASGRLGFNCAESALLNYSAHFAHQAKLQRVVQESASGVDVGGAARREYP